MPQTFTLDHDVSCLKCRYNLRTQPATARCPECGYPVLRSYVHHKAIDGGSHLAPGEVAPLTAVRVLSQLLGRNVDSIAFVLTAYRRASAKSMPRNIFKRAQVDAKMICDSIRDYALEHYGSREVALETLRFWKLEKSEDVGKIVFALVEVGVLTAEEDDLMHDFDGLFTLETLFDQS
jgi:uncharacterized repeat protein (TIGR04138 family)